MKAKNESILWVVIAIAVVWIFIAEVAISGHKPYIGFGMLCSYAVAIMGRLIYTVSYVT